MSEYTLKVRHKDNDDILIFAYDEENMVQGTMLLEIYKTKPVCVVKEAIISEESGKGIPRKLITEGINQLQKYATEKNVPLEHRVLLSNKNAETKLRHLFTEQGYVMDGHTNKYIRTFK